MRFDALALLLVTTLACCAPCDRPALQRDEAFRQATMYLDQMAQHYDFGKTGPVLAKEDLDPDTKLWTFEFRANDCVILIATDACDGADVSGVNAACKSK
jgi:hypothetical protein